MGTRRGSSEAGCEVLVRVGLENSEDCLPLSERIYCGDNCAETELIRLHSAPMRRLILRRVRNAHTAEDLLHDSLLAALVSLRARPLSEPQKLGHYLLRVAKFQTANHLRCKNARMITQAQDDVDCLSGDSDPSRAYQQWSRHQLVRRLVDSLAVARDRRVARRYYIEEDSKANICSDLNISAANFDSIIYRVRQRLRKMVVAFLDGGSDAPGGEAALPVDA